MRISRVFTVGVSLALLLGACAKPVVRPILPEPVYNKYGEVSVAACRPERQPFSNYYPERLLTCESLCLPGEVPSYSSITHVTTVPICVPIDQYEPDDSDEPGRDPTGAPSLTHLG
ncbi:hypothetical protein [Phaeovulum sp.]|uniref:hypothetical protein n=1 Tax=Phaeovulum sp. TaxID=2934796 RepID=UPI0035628F93